MNDEAEYADQLRSVDIIRLMSPKALWRLARGNVRAPFDENYAGHPLAVCWFTNFSCNAKCHFCCKAAEIRAGRDCFPPLELNLAKKLMATIRKTVKMLYLSGGEPIIHPQIIDILAEARRLEFSSIGISSNLIALDRHVEVLDYVDALSVSIHSPDVAVNADNLGVPVSVADKVFKNLELVKDHARRGKIKVLVNCVINHRNLNTVLDMVEFTRRHGFLLEVVPANNHGRIPHELAGNPEYEAVIGALVEMRKSGAMPHLAGSTAYYERILSFKPFRCFPYGVPNVMPDGRLCTPCDVSEQYAVNVLDFPDLKSALHASRPHLGKYPCAAGQCFKAGIVERSHLFGLLVGN